MPATVITRYCVIRNRQLIADGKVLFADKTNDLEGFLMQAYASLQIAYPKFYKMDTLSKLGFLAAEVLLQNRELTKEYAPENIALVLSNAHASLDTDLRYAESAKTQPSPALFVYTLSNIVAGEICIRHKIKGENAFFISAEFDPQLLTDYASIVLSPRLQISSSKSQAPIPIAIGTKSQAPGPNACISGWIDVLGEHHDVFLYLCEKNKHGSVPHTASQLKELYNTPLWNS
jgi:hypothetical protein